MAGAHARVGDQLAAARHNFTRLPPIRSHAPLFDLREGGAAIGVEEVAA